MIKLSEKAKIILAVIAVAVVAAGAVTFAALSINANGVQDDLSSNGGVNEDAISRADDDFSIVFDYYGDVNNEYTGRKWSTDLNNPTIIGMYTGEYIVSNFSTSSTFTYISADISVTEIDAVGNKIGDTETFTDMDDIKVQNAGIYIAEVTVQYDDGGETRELTRNFYAQVKQAEKTVLEVALNSPQTSLTYTGDVIEGFELRLTNSSESIDSLIKWDVSFSDYYTGESSKNGINILTDGLFDVTYAGIYTVTLEIDDSMKEVYKFSNDTDTEELKFEVRQAIVVGRVQYSSEYSNDLTIEQLLSDIVFTPSTATGNNQTGKYSIEYSLFADSEYSTPLTELSVGKEVFVKASIAPYSQGDVAYRNYRLPVQGETGFTEFSQFSFKLTAPALATPSVSINYYNAELSSQIGFPIIQDAGVSTNETRTVIYATYLNFGYKVSQWFYGSRDMWTDTSSQGHNRGENWNVTVSKDGGAPETIDPNVYEMKNAGTYVVTITPKDGFRFAEKQEYVVTLEIKPFTLASGHIVWEGNKKHVYDGNPVNFGRGDYRLNLPELLSEDNDKLVIEFERIKIDVVDGSVVSTVIDEAPVNAGTYYYRIKEDGIKGDVADNYTLTISEINNSTSPFKIYKKELPNYSGTPIITGKFNGKEQVIDVAQSFVDMGLAVINTSADGKEEYVSNIVKLDQLNFSTHITHSYPSAWGVNGSRTVTASFEMGRNFRFTRAGSYAVTFVLPPDSDFGVNHCWYGGNDEPGSTGDNYVWENFILIERAEIDPSLPSLTMSVNDEVIDLKDYIAQRFVSVEVDNPYSLTFGSANKGEQADQFDFVLNDGVKKYEAGEYYLLVDLDEDLYPDCIFNKASAEAGKYKIENDGKRVRIEYSVNSNTVSISYKVTDYVFGDNFAVDFGIENVFTFEKHTIEGATVTFDEPIFEFYTDEQRLQEATLYNGLLPRNAGKYYFKITINYTVDGENFVWARNGELNVDQRQIENFVWTLDGIETSQLSANFRYSGNEHTVSVSATVLSGLPAVNVTLSDSSATNVGEYTFSITGLAGEEANNYSYDRLTNTSFAVNISHAQISVTANDVASIKFGQKFDFDENAYEITGDAKDLFVGENLNANLSLSVYFVGSSSLTLVTEYDSLGCGQYLVIPVYSGKAVPDTLSADNKYVVTVGNFELTMTASSFSVTAEELIVTLYGGSSSVYGDPVNLYVPYDGNAGIYATNLNLSEEEFKRAVTLTATAPTGGASATADKANAGIYRLRAALTEYGQTNYSITVKYVGENGNTHVANYEITRRKITLETNDVADHIYGNGYDVKNNVFNVTSGSILDSDKSGISIYCSVFVYNGQFNNKTSELSNLSVGEYYHIATFGGSVGERLQKEDGTYYTVANVGNYEVTSIASKYEIVPREITLTFTDGSSVYGSSINLWKRQNDFSELDTKYYSTYDYCQAKGLRFDGGDLVNLTDNLKNVITLSLVKDNNVVLTGNGVCNAGTYKFKATIENGNYVIANGTNDGAELIGGQYVVNPKSITIQTTTTKSSVEYGSGLNGVVLDFTVSGLVNGDVKGDLNIVLGVYDGENRIENVAEYGVGNYVIGIDASGINSNYVIAENGIATASFGITKRTITLTFTSDGGASVYGETVTSDMLYAATVGSLANLVNGHTYQNVVALNAVCNGVDVTTANASVGEYLITAVLNSDYSDNYALNVSGQGKYVITPRKVVLKPDAVNHNYGTNYDATAPKYTVEGSFVSSADEKAMQIVAVITNGAGQTVTNSIALQPVGEYTIKLSVTNPNSNYDVDVTTYSATFTILVCKAMVKFNLSTSPSNVYGEPIDLEELRKNIRSNDLFTIDGLLDGDESSVEIKIVKKGDESVSATDKYAPVGDYVLVVTLGDNYDVEYVGWDYDLTKKIYSVTERSVKIGANDVSLVYGNNFDNNKLSYKVADGSLYQPLENDDLKVTLAVFDGENVVSNIATQKVGNYAIKIDKSSANKNYDIEVVDGKFAITQATVKLNANAVSVTYGDELTLSGEWYSASSANTTQATITAYLAANTVTYETNYVKGTTNANATGITITPKCESSDNVKIEVVGAAVSVTKRIITISFTQNGGTSVYGANVDLYDGSVGALAANDLVGLDRYDGVVNLTATLDGQSMADRNYSVGTYVVTATIANSNYIFADSATTASAKGKYVITPAAISWTGSVDANKTYTYSGNAYSVDDVSSKLSFNVANPDVNTVTIEYLVYEAGHSCDATLPWNDATTTVPSYVNAGTYTVYVRFIANNHEIAYFVTQLTLTVNKGILTITAKPHSVTYGDDLSLSENWYTSTSDTITETTIEAYLANNAVNYTTNYVKATTQANENGIIITPSCNGDDNVQINAVDGIVTVDKRAITITYNNDKSSVYGNDVVAKTELYTLIGTLVNENDISVTVLLNGEEASSTSPAGKYEVNVSANKNYDVTYFNAIDDKGEYNINKRPVTVSLVNNSVVYTEEYADGVIKYNGGRYGKTQNVVLKFDGNVEAFESGEHYSVSYLLKGVSAVPNKAGVYDVTISILDNNYELKGVSEFVYEITRKQISSSSFMWEDPTFVVDEINNGIFDNAIQNYVADILRVDSFKMSAGNELIDIEENSDGSIVNNKYYFDENGRLSIRIESFISHVYTATFGLNSEAQENYELVGSEVSNGLIARVFSVSAKAIVAYVNQSGWQYSDKHGDLIVKVLIGDGHTEFLPQGSCVIRYAPVTNVEEAKKLIGDGAGYDLDDVKHLFEDGALSETFSNFDVGYYVICVTYDGIVKDSEGNTEYVAIRRFDVFEVSKKQLKLSQTIDGTMFNGADQLAEVNFDMLCDDGTYKDVSELVTATFNGSTIVKGEKISGKLAKTYEVTVAIKDTDHYVWADEMDAVDGVITITWTIEKDDKAHSDSNRYITIGDIAPVTYGSYVVKSVATARAGYNGTFTWYFALKGSLSDASQIVTWTEWANNVQPTQAGDYFVKIVLSDGENNFTDKIAYDEFKINKATLHITISGTMEYGSAFAKTDCNFSVVESDLINGDTVSVVSGNIYRYYLVNENGDELQIEGLLTVKKYKLSAARDVNGHVYGLTADNYDIVLADYGVFTVTAKAITVTINANGASSQYGLAPDLSGVTVSYSGVDSEEVVREVLANLYTEATATSAVGNGYVISSVYDKNDENKNLEITYTVAYYTITPRKIYVELDASNAGGIYKGTIGEVTIASIKDEKGADVSALVGSDYLTIAYGGQAYDGTTFAYGETHAGQFTATVTGDASNQNFELTDAPVVSFTVEKLALDESLIKATPEQKVYTGEAIEPVLNNVYEGLYNVLSHEPFKAVSKYKLQLQLKDANNYKWTVSVTDIVEVNFEIVKAGIKVVPSGSIVYGQTFADAKLSYKLYYVESGALVEDGVVTVDENLIAYLINDVKYDAAKPVVGKYALEMEKVEEGSDFVKGFTSVNYTIVLEAGEFEVEKRDITIIVHNSSSIYSQSIVLSNGFDVSEQLPWGENKDDVINLTITADPSVWINVGNDYAVTATAIADNYNIVEVISGKHKILPLEVSVTISAKDGEYMGKSVEITTHQTGNVSYDFGVNFADKFTFKYTGTGFESNEAPVNAGSYIVTITAINDGNFELVSSNAATFTITKATLTLVPSGELTYGNKFETGAFGYELTGFKGNDNENVVTKVSKVNFILVNADEQLVVNNQGYALTVELENGFVKGLTADNYNIEAEIGTLTVNARKITIKPKTSSSYYGEQIELSHEFDLIAGTILKGDVIEYAPSTAATPASDVGPYVVTANASNRNYDIKVEDGVHTILKAKVGVHIRPINGTYGEENRGIEYMSIVVIRSDGTTVSVGNMQFTVSYEGTANDNTSYRGSEVPTKAGIYTVTVTGVLNGNYELDASYGDVDSVVVIAKRQIDADKIKATSAAYTGKAIIPHIEDNLYNVNGQKIYNTVFEGSLKEVGTYDLTLSLIDTNNYAWVDNLNRTTTIKFEIVKANNSLVDVNNPDAPADSIKVEILNWTFGETASAPKATVANGKIVFEYSTSENGAYTTEVPRDAGEYWVRATVAESDSYNAFVSKATKFVISKKVVSLPVAANSDGNSVYTGSMLALIIDGFDDQVMSLTLGDGMYRADKDGKLNLLALNANTYQATFKLRNNDNYVWADDAQLVDGAVVVNWTVERQVIKRLPDATNKILVNGEDIVFIPEGFNSGIMTIENNVHAHEGSFSAIVTLKDTDNYVWEGTDSASIAVNFELTGTNTAFIAAICVVAGLCVGLAVMAVILTLVNRNKKRKEAEAIDARSRADGWEGDE